MHTLHARLPAPPPPPPSPPQGSARALAEQLDLSKLDITGQGTCLGPRPGADTAPSVASSAPSTPAGSSASSDVPVGAEPKQKARPHSGRMPTRKQQKLHAIQTQAAHVLTSDFVALSELASSTTGVMLLDKTNRKLKLVRSLGELLPARVYTTEFGNELERKSKTLAVLAGKLELEVHSDEVDFEAALGRLALTSHTEGLELKENQRMAAYAAFVEHGSEAATGPREHGSDGLGGGGGGGASHANGLHNGYGGAAAHAAHAAAAAADGGATEWGGGEARALAESRLREAEALSRLEAMVERMGEMESWFDGAKAEAERERRMREQAAARLEVVSERLERCDAALGAANAENARLREKLEDLAFTIKHEGADPTIQRVAPKLAAKSRFANF